MRRILFEFTESGRMSGRQRGKDGMQWCKRAGGLDTGMGMSCQEGKVFIEGQKFFSKRSGDVDGR
jgi:hypothetical protein